MHYIRFVGGSFGTALATNDLQKFMAESYDRTVEIQNYQRAWSFLEILTEWGSITEEKAKYYLQSIQSLYALSDSFERTLFNAGYWALLGVIPILYLLYQSRKSLKPSMNERA
jgi:DHA2 family multidrug resistance protein